MSTKNNLDDKINIFALGNSEVGKTCSILKYTDNVFQEVHLMTAGIDLKTKIIEHSNGKIYKINFYDTAGQERYRSISVNSIKNSDGIVLMYDITKQKSYEDISIWIESIKQIKKEDFPMILLGNKCDLEDKRVVSEEEGEELANKFGLKFFETSNKTGKNINEAADELINQIIEIKEKQKDEKQPGEKNNYNFELNKEKTKVKEKEPCKC